MSILKANIFADFSLNAPLLRDTDYRREAAEDARAGCPSQISKFFFGWCRPLIAMSRDRLLEVSKR